ncbi:MAG: EAL domain-containing protein [Pseudoxanthomonas sp.]
MLQNLDLLARGLFALTKFPTFLSYLHWGLILALAMLRPPYLRFGWFYLAVTLTAAARAALLIDFPLWSPGMAHYVAVIALHYALMYPWTVWCARMAGWPRPRREHRMKQRDVLLLGVVSILYPLGWTISYVGLNRTLMPYPMEAVLDMAITFFFSRYCAALAVTAPVLLLAMRRHAQARSLRTVRPWEWALVLAYLAVGFSLGWSHYGLHHDLAEAVLVQRYTALALLIWSAMRLPWGIAVWLSSVVMLCMVGAAGSDVLDAPGGDGRALLRTLFELGLMQQVSMALLISSHAQQRLVQRLIEQTRRDPISGVPNLEALRHDLRRREDQRAHIACLSVEHVEGLIAAFGLPAKEALAAALHRHLEDKVAVYTLGMDRFALLRLGPAPLWREVLRSLESFEFEYAGMRVHLEPHLGAADVKGHDDAALDGALQAAWHALSQARERAETLPVIADSMVDNAAERRRWDTYSLTLSLLRQNAIELHLQPIRPLRQPRSGAVASEMAEVLCRLRGPEELLLPGVYLAELETARGLVELDVAVLSALLAWMRTQPDNAGYQRLAVNLTGPSLASEPFRRWLLHELDAFPGVAQRLCIEVTEHAVADGIHHAKPLLDGLHARGCLIALDDFGTGMQGFHRLQQLPIDLIKIDGAFIKGIVACPRDRELVRAMVSIARAFGAQTVAEYVEDAQILALLDELGVDWGQGFHLGRPSPLPVPVALAH